MVSTRSKTRASSTGNVAQRTQQPGIAAFARTSKSGAGLSAAATAGKAALLAKTKTVGNETATSQPKSQTKKRKLDVVEDEEDLSTASGTTVGKARKIEEEEVVVKKPSESESEFKVPELPRTVTAITTPKSSSKTKASPSRSPSQNKTGKRNSTLGFAKLSNSQRSPSVSASSYVESSQDVAGTQDTGITSPEPESSSDVEEGDHHHDDSTKIVKEVSVTDSKPEDDVEKTPGSRLSLEEEETLQREILSDKPTQHHDETVDTTDSRNSEDDTRPTCYHDIISLHTSFLTALSFHYAHNNPSAPADLREFLPCIEKIWKKRGVAVEEFRRMVFVANQIGAGGDEKKKAEEKQESKDLRIVTYGPGKTCLELSSSADNLYRPPVKDEGVLREKFWGVLERLWLEWRDSSATTSKDTDPNNEDTTFLSSISLEPITTSKTTTPLTTPRIGRQRLLEFNQGNLKLRSLKSQDSTIHESAARARRSRKSSTTATTSTASRKSSLLDRIRAKETQAANKPPPLTPEQSLRVSASQHVAEVRSILACMRPSQGKLAPQRKAYRWDEAVGNVLQSLKMPVGRREIEVCLEMIAGDEGCGWVKCVQVGEMKSLVLMSGGLKGWITFPEKKGVVGGGEKKEE
ncbi:hypothetical protein AAP_01517 [Ascosphaera apis ARSEF 7405]|uniref:DNA replication factor Cdt1 C-terminal domain-containing protein n=1 Tax=Ascosphaera apis ARSEF 7405 TaxID=392613 RepID=A0A168BAF7_9EURO|nr:hypothetical protein AAP_01517 [Ascosphaera apis ARSEF 7405]